MLFDKLINTIIIIYSKIIFLCSSAGCLRKEVCAMNSAEKLQLQILACKSRMGAIIGTFNAKSGHPGGSLSAADIYTYLYFKEREIEQIITTIEKIRYGMTART